MNALTGTTLGIAIFGLLLSIITFLQKVKTDKRSEWWKRTAWCFDNLARDLKVIAKGILVYNMTTSKLITNEEKAVLDIAITEDMNTYFSIQENKK